MINHWWTTRPKRKLISAVDALRIFASVAEGKKWQANRELHLDFEDMLESGQVKREGERRDRQGSGGRTYAALLFSFGLWYTDQRGIVRLTIAGADLLKGLPPVPILTKQILNFQYPSTNSRNPRIDVNPRFRLFPFRFLLKLLLNDRLGYLTKEEIARFVITKAETDGDLEEIVQSIEAYRNSGNDDSIFNGVFQERFGSLPELEHVANTFINQLEFTQLVYRPSPKSPLRLNAENRSATEQYVNNQPALIRHPEREEYFQRRYGIGTERKKDTRTFGEGPTISANDMSRRQVIFAFNDILRRSPIQSISKKVISEISSNSGVSETEVERILTQVEATPSLDAFEQTYIQYAFGARALAKEFERATEGIFGGDGLGFETEWIGPQPNNPDILAISLAEGNRYLGILDTKAYQHYSISADHRRAMLQDYIPRYREREYGGQLIPLEFFGYVAGGFKSTIDANIEGVSHDGNVKGFAITAQDLLRLLKKHRQAPYDKRQLQHLFTLNKQVLPSHFL